MAQATRANHATDNHVLITVNCLQISLMIRYPFVARAFRAAEDVHERSATDSVRRSGGCCSRVSHPAPSDALKKQRLT